MAGSAHKPSSFFIISCCASSCALINIFNFIIGNISRRDSVDLAFGTFSEAGAIADFAANRAVLTEAGCAIVVISIRALRQTVVGIIEEIEIVGAAFSSCAVVSFSLASLALGGTELALVIDPSGYELAIWTSCRHTLGFVSDLVVVGGGVISDSTSEAISQGRAVAAGTSVNARNALVIGYSAISTSVANLDARSPFQEEIHPSRQVTCIAGQRVPAACLTT